MDIQTSGVMLRVGPVLPGFVIWIFFACPNVIRRSGVIFRAAISLLVVGRAFGDAASSRPSAAQPTLITCGCFILSKETGLLRNHPGLMCAYLPSGQFVSIGENSDKLSLYNKDNTKVWERKGHYHHQLRFGRDQNSILAMSSSFHGSRKKRVRYDVLQVLDLKGKVLKEFDFYTHRKKLQALAPGKLDGFPRKELAFPDIVWEFSHANSFYEIQSNAIEKTLPAFKAGNYIANSNLLGLILVLDANLKRILWSYHYPDNTKDNSHDVQVLANGHLLIYNNDFFDGDRHYTTLDEFDLINKKLVWRYTASPPESLHVLQGGGLQKLSNGHVLFTAFTKPGVIFELDARNNVIWSGPDLFTGDDGQPRYVQEAKYTDVSEYLLRNSGF